ncbi:MAG TPA: DUF4440 domain-containing protein [Terriglobales bacterium]|nr:DUF4440 domain-containing protein [Terriglobales bacterium]
MSGNPNQPPLQRPEAGELLPNSAVDEFFQKMNYDLRRPKPSEEMVAAALRAIQRIVSEAAVEGSEALFGTQPSNGHSAMEACPKCGEPISASNRFCGFCGGQLDRNAKAGTAPVSAAEPAPRGKHPQDLHIHHHHYHHHYINAAQPEIGAGKPRAEPTTVTPQPEDPETTEESLRKVVQEWEAAYKAKRLDRILALCLPDTIVMRPDAAPVSGRSAIREYLQGTIEAGWTDVHLQCTEVSVLGEFAWMRGTTRMMFPVAPGIREPRSGKFLMFARREGTGWKLVADVWCADTAVAVHKEVVARDKEAGPQIVHKDAVAASGGKKPRPPAVYSW